MEKQNISLSLRTGLLKELKLEEDMLIFTSTVFSTTLRPQEKLSENLLQDSCKLPIPSLLYLLPNKLMSNEWNRDREGTYCRVVKLGTRRNDAAPMARVEYVNNRHEIFDTERKNKMMSEKGLTSFWEWELKILEQEKQFYENEVLRLQGGTPALEEGEEDAEMIDDDLYSDQVDSKEEEDKQTEVSSINSLPNHLNFSKLTQRNLPKSLIMENTCKNKTRTWWLTWTLLNWKV